MGHIINEFVNVFILDLFLIGVHDILHVLVEHIHTLFFSHKSFHGLFVALVFHFVAGIAHDLGHPGHNILHGFVYRHLLESRLERAFTRR